MSIREGKITNCAALSIFLLTMSRLSQEQYNITISMRIYGASINTVEQYFNLMFMAIRYQDCRPVFIILGLFAITREMANKRVITPAQDRYMHPLDPK